MRRDPDVAAAVEQRRRARARSSPAPRRSRGTRCRAARGRCPCRAGRWRRSRARRRRRPSACSARLQDDADVRRTRRRAGRGRARASRPSSTSPPCRCGRSVAARARSRSRGSPAQSSGSSSSPSPVSLTLTFASSPCVVDRGEHVVVGLGDRLASSGVRDLLAQHVDGRELSLRVQRRDDAPRVGRARARRCSAPRAGGRPAAAPPGSSRTIARSSSAHRRGELLRLAHEALAGGATRARLPRGRARAWRRGARSPARPARRRPGPA